MFNSLQYADALAHAVERIGASAEAGEEQKAALRALAVLAGQKSATVRCYEGALSVDDLPVPAFAPTAALLIERLQLHGVTEIVIGRGAEPAELLALIRGLCAEGGQGRIKEKLRDVESTRVMVIIDRGQDVGPRRPRSVTQAFEKSQIDESARAEWNRFLSSSVDKARDTTMDFAVPAKERQPEPVAWPEPADHLSADPAMQDSAPAAHAPEPAALVPPVPAVPAVRATTAARRAGGPPPPPPPPLPPPPPRTTRQAAPPPPPPGLPALSDAAMRAALEAVLADPYGEGLLPRVTQLGRLLETALREERIPDVLRVVEVVVALESAAPEDASRSSYGSMFGRLLTQSTIVLLMPALTDPRYADLAAVAVRRGRDVSADVLLGLLASAESLGERRACLVVLRSIPKGLDKVLRLLRDPRWLVVRNVAEAVGELHLDEAVPYVTRLLEHEDARVRRAALVAIARTGSAATVEPLRKLMKEGAAETRSLIAGSIGGAWARSLVGPMQEWIEGEAKPETVAELLRALGRIGTADAVEALARAAAPGGRILARKSASLRLAAVEGLRLAGSAGQGSLEPLASDADKTVRAAATRALGRG